MVFDSVKSAADLHQRVTGRQGGMMVIGDAALQLVLDYAENVVAVRLSRSLATLTKFLQDRERTR